MQRFVIYTRVSTEDQGRSGLGLEAQERDIDIYLNAFVQLPYEVSGRFCDVLSGGDDARPQLTTAIELAKRLGAELLVSKIDRLSRKMTFIAGLMDDPKLKLRVAQMPTADRFQLHLFAALAEQERKFVSERTKAALRAAKERGVKLGGLRDATMKRNVAVQVKANDEAQRSMKTIAPLLQLKWSLGKIAAHLNDLNTVKTSRGGKWTPMQVSRVVARASTYRCQA